MTQPKLSPREAMRILAEGGEVQHLLSERLHRVLENGRHEVWCGKDPWQLSGLELVDLIQDCTLPPVKPDHMKEMNEAIEAVGFFGTETWKKLFHTAINTAVRMAKEERGN